MKKRSLVPPMQGVSAFLSTPLDPEREPTSTIPIGKISLPTQQPRQYFDPDKLERLAGSIREYGILEPLLVRPLPSGDYELVAGERRYRAAKMAGLSEIPVIVRQLSEREAWQLALVENLQREDLNPVEETEGILELLKLELQCERAEIFETLAQIATARKKGTELSENVFRRKEALSKILEATIGLTPESFRVARLPLLNLPTPILEALRRGKIEYTKARLISRLKDPKLQQQLLEEAISSNLSLAQIKSRFSDLSQIPQAEDSTPTTSDRLASLSKKLKRVGALDPKQQKRLNKLLQELESLVGD